MSLMPDRRRALGQFPVSRETEDKLATLVDETIRWNTVKNIVGPTFADDPWIRHVADSLQLLKHAPNTGLWVDIGSGGGYPGLVVACLRTEQGLGRTQLIESNSRKCGFLRHMIARLQLDADVIEGRIETSLPECASYVSARAVAPLAQLITWTNRLLRTGTLGIFPKGQDVEKELVDAASYSNITVRLASSLTDPGGRIALVRMSPPAESREESSIHDHAHV